MFLKHFAKTWAPEFPFNLVWLNSDPLMMKKLRGEIVLIDFWTYSCVNCLRTLPHVKRFYEKYAKFGLNVIGVHSPEFAFEKEQENVEAAVMDLGVKYPVVLDSDFAVWNLYANRAWPHLYLVDGRGRIVYEHVGEGGEGETENAIREALREIGAMNLPAVEDNGHDHGDGVCYPTTPEIYLGYLRGHIGNAHDKMPDAEDAYDDVGEKVDDVPYIHGHWKGTAEYVEHMRSLAVATEYLALKYKAFEVNVVMGTANDEEAIVDVVIDGKPVPASMAGKDVVIDANGTTHVHVRQHRMYNVINADHYHSATLKLGVRHAGVRMFALTFGGCKSA